jgi:membrane-associated protease RseP (regulator of RpoE activity)
MVSFTIDKFKDTWVKGFSGYSQIFNFLATFLILASILYQSLGGKKVDWETALLFTSLGFIFLSTAKASRSYLYLGTMFLIVYIFDIGGEYFSDNVGWPITLLIAGVLSMGVGFVFEQLRKRYLPKQ